MLQIFSSRSTWAEFRRITRSWSQTPCSRCSVDCTRSTDAPKWKSTICQRTVWVCRSLFCPTPPPQFVQTRAWADLKIHPRFTRTLIGLHRVSSESCPYPHTSYLFKTTFNIILPASSSVGSLVLSRGSRPYVHSNFIRYLLHACYMTAYLFLTKIKFDQFKGCIF